MQGIIGVGVLLTSVFLFKKAAGTLSLLKLNLINMFFYSILFFQGIGTCIVAFGFREHYLLDKIRNVESFHKGYIGLSIVGILLPLVIICLNKKTNFKIKEKFDEYLTKDAEKTDDQNMFKMICVLAILGVATIIYILYYIGYIPVIEMFLGRLDFAVERINISREFAGNQYIRNLLGGILIPFISYISYTYMRIYKDKKWSILTLITITCGIIIKTSDFSKAPIVIYLAGFVLVEIILKKINIKKLILFGIIGSILLIGGYITVGGYSGKYLSLTNGPLSRLLITQTGTMFLHFDAIEDGMEYLEGSSFPKEFDLFNKNIKHDARAGRIVMEKYNQKAVENGTAGVMNTIYIGEAYMNFGFIGIVMATFWIAIVGRYCVKKFIVSKKNALNIALYVQVSMILITCFQGGVVDYFYNISIIFILIVYFMLYIVCEKGSNEMIKDVLYINFVDLDFVKSGSSVRPKKIYDELLKMDRNIEMLTGLQNRKIERWKKCWEYYKKIRKKEYDICYIEPPAGPIFNLSDHLIILYIKIFKKAKIKLFYRDAYWKFADWYEVSGIKRIIINLMHKFDWLIFRSTCEKIYFPSKSMADLFKFKNKGTLPPGCELINIEKREQKQIRLIYVGGLSEEYGGSLLLEAIKQINETQEVILNLVCRKDEFTRFEEEYGKVNWLNVYNASGNELKAIYEQSNLAIIPRKIDKYMNFAMPVKLFEYITYEIPIIATNCYEVANFINKNEIGKVCEDNSESIVKVLKEIDNTEIENMKKNMINVKYENSWKKRVEEILK